MHSIWVSIPHRQAKNTECQSVFSLRNFVSIPHRQAKNGRDRAGDGGADLVSIPHRQAKNEIGGFCCGQIKLVSIPHRQAKNFRLLISPRKNFPFQFLIGRLKTPAGKPTLVPESEFQFLIGRLKTLPPPLRVLLPVRVSIPHRQAKNAEDWLRLPERIEFQFLIGRLKTPSRSLTSPTMVCFNSSQVG